MPGIRPALTGPLMNAPGPPICLLVLTLYQAADGIILGIRTWGRKGAALLKPGGCVLTMSSRRICITNVASTVALASW
jgi:hypothetical protein